MLTLAMFAELNSLLSISPENISQGDFCVISERHCDASFLIHHFLSFYLRARCKVCFLGLAQSFSHYSAISQRLGVSLVQAKEKGQLVFLEALHQSLSHLIPQRGNVACDALNFLSEPSRSLQPLFEFVGDGCGGSEDWGPPVLLVDDVGVLLSLGVSAGAVLDFSHYCRATVCSQLQGNVVMLVHCEEDEADDEGSELLLRGLTHQSSLTLHVQGLPTGYCRDIHGQMEVCWRSSSDGKNMLKKLFQYKVHDKGALFFARGTSSAVL